MHTTPRIHPSASSIAAKLPRDPRAAKILARTLYKDMLGHGLDPQQILGVASELIGLLTEDLRGARTAEPHARTGRA